MAEPYLGPLFGQPKAAFLALNPGPVKREFQYRDGKFPCEISEHYKSYHAWAASWPYLRAPWKRTSSHTTSRLRFLKDWCADPSLGPEAMLAFELYPWHSERLTSRLRVPPKIVREYVLDPISASGAPVVFAFGADWFRLIREQAHDLALQIVAVLGPEGDRPCPGRVTSRSVVVAKATSGMTLIVEKKRNHPSPPARDDTLLLREAIGHLTVASHHAYGADYAGT